MEALGHAVGEEKLRLRRSSSVVGCEEGLDAHIYYFIKEKERKTMKTLYVMNAINVKIKYLW
jgi:hypothetical protein